MVGKSSDFSKGMRTGSRAEDLSRSVARKGPYTPCFTPGTLIKTDQGEIPVEDITPGMYVFTRDNGYQEIVWCGQRRLSVQDLKQMPELQPVRICKSALGRDLPYADMLVSPQHRMLLSNAQIRNWTGSDEVLIAAHLLTCFDGIASVSLSDITYLHVMCAQHEIILANGAWTESFQPREMSSGGINEAHRKELLAIFPDLEKGEDAAYPAARKEVFSAQPVPLTSSGRG